MFLSLPVPNPDLLVEIRIRLRILLSSSKNTTVLWLLYDILFWKNDVNVPSKSNTQKNVDMDLRIRIRTKISWIRNTGKEGLPVIGPAPLPRPPPGRPNFHRLLAGAAGCFICPNINASLLLQQNTFQAVRHFTGTGNSLAHMYFQLCKRSTNFI